MKINVETPGLIARLIGWPFNIFRKRGKMSINKVDDRFATTGQVRPEDVEHLAQQGYRTIVCARPDDEEQGQPAFAEIAREAERHGMNIVHIPVSGPPSPEQVARFEKAIKTMEGPVLGYCRGGSRAAALYAAIARS